MMATATANVINIDTWEYQTPTTIMAPYRAEQTNFYPQDYLVSLHYRLVEQDLLDTIFPGMNITHLNQFINYLSSPAHPTLCCFVKDDEGIATTAGFGYITESDGRDGCRKAGFGFGFFREWWGTPAPRALSWLMLAFWIIELKIDVLFGTTLKQNSLARNFSTNFGFEHVADIPKLFFRRNTLEDATILMLNRETFLPKYQEWKNGTKGS